MPAFFQQRAPQNYDKPHVWSISHQNLAIKFCIGIFIVLLCFLLWPKAFYFSIGQWELIVQFYWLWRSFGSLFQLLYCFHFCKAFTFVFKRSRLQERNCQQELLTVRNSLKITTFKFQVAMRNFTSLSWLERCWFVWWNTWLSSFSGTAVFQIFSGLLCNLPTFQPKIEMKQ